VIASPVRKAWRSQFHTLATPGVPAEGLARVCARPKVAACYGSPRYHGWSSQ
jgi:hypothetical protein